MALTRHGWPIAGTPLTEKEKQVAHSRCGGPTRCTICAGDEESYNRTGTISPIENDYNETVKRNFFQPDSPIMRYFEYEHLPEKLQSISKWFYGLADSLDKTLPDGPEKEIALHKLLESKDAAGRAALDI